MHFLVWDTNNQIMIDGRGSISQSLYSAIVSAGGQPNPSNESPTKAPSNEDAGDPEPTYTPLDVWVK